MPNQIASQIFKLEKSARSSGGDKFVPSTEPSFLGGEWKGGKLPDLTQAIYLSQFWSRGLKGQSFRLILEEV